MLFIRTAGKDTNQTREPFFSLKLDINVSSTDPRSEATFAIRSKTNLRFLLSSKG